MKKILALLLLCFTTVTLTTAQNKYVSLSGSIIDADEKAPVAQATVQLLSLPDSTFVSGEASSNNGYFKFPNLKAGKYALKVSFVGYQTLIKSIELSAAKPSVNLGQLALQPDAIMLGSP